MKIDGALSSALQTLQRSHKGMQQAAHEIANAPTGVEAGTGDINTALVSMLEHRQQFQAGAEVIKAVDDMIGTLFDDKA